MSNSTSPESAIAFSPADTTFRKKMSGDAIEESFDNLPTAIQRADHTILFDNSTDEGYRLVAVLSPTGSQWFEPIPDWATENRRP